MILVTGGAGYIGSHTCVELLKSKEEIVVFDNFSNSRRESLRRVEKISGKSLIIVEGDIRDQGAVCKALTEHKCTAVVHFAGLKAVQESVTAPLDYYENNVIGTYHLLRAMQHTHVKRIIFSSSATVYGIPDFLPYTEDHPLRPINPYGRTKLVIEDMLRDVFAGDPSWAIGILRYFNPIGAHESGLIGEDPKGTPNNLLPFVAHVAVGRRERVDVFGDDYDTPDGTGIRDYVHVMDLADGHVAALKALDVPKCFAVNLGTGAGSSVREVIKAFENASGKQIAFKIKPRRQGDLDAFYAATDCARELLGWRARRTLDVMCVDHWRWQRQNPDGYATAGNSDRSYSD